MPTITFVKEKKAITVPEGSNLRNEAIKAGIVVNRGVNGLGDGLFKYANCMGKGLCGTCRVNIVKGMENANSLTTFEYVRFKTLFTAPDPLPQLAYVGNEDKMRLACCVTVNGDLEVENAPDVNLFGENFFS